MSVLPTITKASVLALCAETSLSHKKCFFRNTGLQLAKQRPTFSFPKNQHFLKTVFENQTGFKLYNGTNPPHYYKFVDPKEIAVIQDWEKKQGTLIFISDKLSGSIALDYNFFNNTGKRTTLGSFEEDAKHNGSLSSIDALAKHAVQAINHLPAYASADFICAIPAAPEKAFDLPRELAQRIAKIVSKSDITPHFIFENKKESVKDLHLDKKWGAWEAANPSYSSKGPSLVGKTVILIDDKYQSGVTLHYVAMKLQQAGATHILGLCMVKTLKDTDNV